MGVRKEAFIAVFAKELRFRRDRGMTLLLLFRVSGAEADVWEEVIDV